MDVLPFQVTKATIEKYRIIPERRTTRVIYDMYSVRSVSRVVGMTAVNGVPIAASKVLISAFEVD